MKKYSILFLGLFLCLNAVAQGLKVNGSQLTYNGCENILLRGANVGTYFMLDVNNPQAVANSLAGLKQTHANTARLVWSGQQEYNRTANWLDSIIRMTVSNKMIPIPELHDHTCGNLSTSVASAVDYWLSPQVLPTLLKYDTLLILNIANEVGPWDGTPTAALTTQFISAYMPQITRLRNAGLTCPLMIDAPYCGQNIEVLVAAGGSLLASDPLHNLIFSFHAYWSGSQSESSASVQTTRLTNALNSPEANGLCIVMGEFAVAMDCIPTALTCPYNALMQTANTNHIGYMAWEWSASTQYSTNGACPDDERGYARLSMTDGAGTFAGLAGWGTDVANDIAATSIEPLFFTTPCGAGPLGIKDHEESLFANEVKLFPNPANTSITIQSNGKGLVSVTIMDLRGQVLYQSSLRTSETIDLSHFPPAVYFIRFNNETDMAVKKFIKQ